MDLKRSVYWNSYHTIPARVIEKRKNIYKLLSASFQGVKRLFVLDYFIAPDDAKNEAGIKNKKYFLPRRGITSYNELTDGRNFYDQPIDDLIKQYNEGREVSTEKGDDYTTGCLLDYAYFKVNYKLTAIDLSKQKALDVDAREIQQVVFQGVVSGTKIRLCTILEKSKC